MNEKLVNKVGLKNMIFEFKNENSINKTIARAAARCQVRGESLKCTLERQLGSKRTTDQN